MVEKMVESENFRKNIYVLFRLRVKIQKKCNRHELVDGHTAFWTRTQRDYVG